MDAMDGGDPTLIISDDLDVGFSGGGNALFPQIRRRESYRSLARTPPPARSDEPAIGFFFDDLSDEEPNRHFLDSCALCKIPLTGNRDIFMYRGDTPFCSEECREEQMEADEAKERRRSWKFSTSTANQQSEPRNSQKIHATVVAS